RFHWNKRTRSDFEKAAEYFQAAVDKDANFALAYSGLAVSLSLMSVYGFATPLEAMPKAKQAALKAIVLDDALAEGHASLGFILNDYGYDRSGAEAQYKRAIELSPNYTPALLWYGEQLTQLARHDESIAILNRALLFDPFSLILNRMYGE